MVQQSETQIGLPWETSVKPPREKAKPKKLANELDGATWERYSISIWSDIRKSPDEIALKHPAIFPAQLVGRLIECFTTKDDNLILDPFAGIGSTVVAAHRLGKKGIGIEIEPRFVEKGNHRLDTLLVDSGSKIYSDDARNLSSFVSPETVDMVITSPPYWDILLAKRTADGKEIRHYGEAEADLGKIHEYKRFLEELTGIFRLVFQVMKAGKYCCVVVMDLRKKSQFYSYHSDVAKFMQEIGFIYDDIIIWDRRSEYSNMRPLGYPYRFRINKAHEYILIFQKPLGGKP